MASRALISLAFLTIAVASSPGKGGDGSLSDTLTMKVWQDNVQHHRMPFVLLGIDEGGALIAPPVFFLQSLHGVDEADGPHSAVRRDDPWLAHCCNAILTALLMDAGGTVCAGYELRRYT